MRKQLLLSTAAALTLLTGLRSQAQTYSNAVMALNPVAYWPLGETVASPAGLYVANNSGTLGALGNGYYETWYQPMGGTTMLPTNVIQHPFGVTPDSDKALQASMVGQFVVIPRNINGAPNPAVSINPPFSVELWVYPTNTAGYLKPLVNQGFNNSLNGDSLGNQAVQQGWSVGCYNSSFYFNVFNGAGTKTEVGTGTFTSGTWHHLVATFDGTIIRIYDNGKLTSKTVTARDALNRIFAPDLVSPLFIGAGGGQNSPFGGIIDEVAIYTNVLSAQTITNHFFAQTTNSPASYYATTVQGDTPVIYLRLNEADFTTAPDLSTCPVANNYGSLGAAANGRFQPGAAPGVAGPSYNGFGTPGSSRAVALNGFNAGVDIGGGSLPAQLNPTANQPLTVLTWFKANPADCVARFQEILGHSDLGWRMAMDYNAGNRFNPGAGPELYFGSISEVFSTGMFMNDGNWHFAAGVSDGTNDYLYLDGMLAKSGTSAGSIAGTNLDVMLGGDPQYTAPALGPGGSRYFNGSMAQVAFFTNALTAAQIQGLYTAAGVPPTVRAQPTSQVLNESTTASIPAVIAGSAPITYQWYRNGVRASGQTGSSLNFDPVTTASAGTYYLAATNSYGWTTSAVITVTVFRANTYEASVRQFNPVGYWPLNETAQAPSGYYIANNLGSAGHAGDGYYQTWYVPTSAAGKNTFYPTNNIQRVAGATGDGDMAMLCAGTAGAGQYVVFPHTTNGVDNPAVTVTAPFTLELWVYVTNNTAGLRPIISQGRNPIQGDASKSYTNTYRGFSLGMYQPNIYFGVYDDNHKDHNGQPSLNINNIATNVWHHITATYDGATMTLYSNGVSMGSVAATYVPDTVSPLLIGTGTTLSAANGGQEFGGAIDDVAIYQTALSQEQIQAHYAAQTSGTYSSAVQADGPSIYLRLNETAFTSYPSPSSYPVATNYGSLGAGANGLYMPGTTPGAAGPSYPGFSVSGAVAFNGFYGAVDVGGGLIPALLNPKNTQPLTVAAWFQGNPADAPARFQELVSHGNSSWRLTLDTSVAGNRFNSGTNSTDLQFDNLSDMVTNNFVVNDGNWHMAVGVFDGANESLYIDGALAKTRTGAKPMPGSSVDVFIGGSPEQTVPSYNSANRIRYFDGQIAQVAFFTNALSPSQIQQMYGAAGVPLYIVSQPQPTQVNSGTTGPVMTFGVRGSYPMYQWYKTNTTTGVVSPVVGQTNASLAFNPAVLGNSGYYFAIATNAYNSVTSDVAQLTVVGPPVVVEQSPADIKVFVGTTPTLHVSMIGPSLYYQWSSNNVAIPGANGPDLTLTADNTRTVGATTYRCSITNTYGSVSASSVVTVLADPTAQYPASVLADRPVAYFRLNEPGNGFGDPNNGVTAYDYAGGNNAVYNSTWLAQPGYAPVSDPTTTAAEFGDFGGGNNFAGNVPSYLNFATPSGGNAQFSVEAWVNKYLYMGGGNCIVALGYGGGGEQFVLDTGNQAAGNLRFFVRDPAGNGYHANSNYKIDDSLWHHVVGVCDQAGGHIYVYLDGQLVGSSTIPAGIGLLDSDVPLSIGARQSGNSSPANYDFQLLGKINDVAIYNYALSQAQIQNHYFKADVAPLITQIQPPVLSLNEGSSATITVTATGAATLAYQWYDPAYNPIGANSPTLTLNNMTRSQSGAYTVTVTNPYGSATTNAQITVNYGAPVIQVDLQPLNHTVYAATPLTYSVTVSGTPPFTYQWYRNGILLPGVAGSTYSFSALEGTYTYQCKVLNADSGGIPTESAIATVVGMPITTLNPTNYTDNMKITFAGYNRGETLADFPVLVRLGTNLAGFNYGHFASPTGGDLRFTDAGGTRIIPHEIDQWNPAGESTVWVQLPRLSGTNDCVWAYWGNPATTTPPPGTNVWTPQAWEGLPPFKLVYHMKEGALPFADSTLQHPTVGGVAPAATTGIVGTGGAFDGNATYLSAGPITDLGQQFTLSSWVYVNSGASDEQVLWRSKVSGGWNGDGYQLFINQWGTSDRMLRLESGNGTGGAAAYSAVGAVSYGQWHMVTTTFNRDTGRARLFLDGADITVGTGLQTDYSITSPITIGGPSLFLNGALDEVRIQSGTNSANWIWASYMTVAQNAALQSYSSVTSTVPVVPIDLGDMTYQVSGNNLVLSGSGGAGAVGKSYQVWATTNVALPMPAWTPVTTNSFDSSGNFSVTLAVDPARPQQFFRIVVP